MVVLLQLGMVSIAVAQPALTAPSESVAPVQEKDPSVAVMLSVGITAGGAAALFGSSNESIQLLGFGAMYFGPSTGHWYSGELGGMGLGLRALGLVSALYGVTQLSSEDACEFHYEDCTADDEGSDSVAAVFMVSGATLWVGSTIADVVLARRAALRWNQRHAISIAPTAFASGGQRVPGLVLTGRF